LHRNQLFHRALNNLGANFQLAGFFQLVLHMVFQFQAFLLLAVNLLPQGGQALNIGTDLLRHQAFGVKFDLLELHVDFCHRFLDLRDQLLFQRFGNL